MTDANAQVLPCQPTDACLHYYTGPAAPPAPRLGAIHKHKCLLPNPLRLLAPLHWPASPPAPHLGAINKNKCVLPFPAAPVPPWTDHP